MDSGGLNKVSDFTNTLTSSRLKPLVKPIRNTTEMGQAIKTPVASFSHAETNPRVTVARLILDGQYERAAIISGLYVVDYEELVHECGLTDDPRAKIL